MQRETQLSLQRETQLHISVELVLTLLLLGSIFAIRVTDILYNSLFVDEAIYATVGGEVLRGDFSQYATAWFFGSYLYSLTAATADQMGGIVALRLLSAGLSTLSAVFVFLVAYRLFDRQSALWATLVFGFTGASISLGQFAVLDALAVPFLAASLYCMVMATREWGSDGRRETYYLIASGVLYSLAVLSKYITILYLPALGWVGFLLYAKRGRSIFSMIRGALPSFMWPIVLILGGYILYYFNDLKEVFTGRYAAQPASRGNLIRTIMDEIGVIIPAALVGLFMLFRAAARRAKRAGRRQIGLLTVAVVIMALVVLAVPIFHVVTGNARALEKHVVYSLVFLAPLAGLAIATGIRKGREYPGFGARIIGASITAILLIWFVNYSLDRNWVFQHSWPDLTGAVEYLRSEELSSEDRVLASASAIYEYYLDFGPANRQVWFSTWFLEYEGRTAAEAMTAAIDDHYFDYVVLDDYYAPEMNPPLEGALRQAGYTLEYRDAQVLLSGDTIGVRVYSSGGVTANHGE